MDAGRRQILALALAIIGVLGTIIICALPMWKTYINSSVSHDELYGAWYGLWKICSLYNTGKTQCYAYDVLHVPEAINAARALIILAIISGIFGILLGVAGNKRTNLMLDDGQKCKVAFASGVVFIIAGVLVIIPVSWIARIVIHEFNMFRGAPFSVKLGASLYIGWFTAGFLFLGGGLLLLPSVIAIILPEM